MAPFAVVGPLIGPVMDRSEGGRRTLLIGAAAGRAVLAVLMVPAVSNDSLVLFPEAFVMLILAKSHQVAKAAIVPTVVSGDAELVEANSKLQLLSGLAGFAAGLPGLLALLIGPGAVMVLAAVAFSAADGAGARGVRHHGGSRAGEHPRRSRSCAAERSSRPVPPWAPFADWWASSPS